MIPAHTGRFGCGILRGEMKHVTLTSQQSPTGAEYAVLVHGGAGAAIAELHADGRAACLRAAEKAATLLDAGGWALDAVQAAVEILEDAPSLAAATGAALTRDGAVELDASIMEGSGLRAGAVCALPPYRNPVAIARAALEDGEHVLYAGAGADAFARARGFEPVAAEALITPRMTAQLARWLAQRGARERSDTVGAVARDRAGRVAYATSTGGILGKRSGRVGDSPIVGAGGYADDRSGAVSATGEGEGILRVALSRSVLAGLAHAASAEQAARDALQHMAERVGCVGGLILVTPTGQLVWARSTEDMPWAAASSRAAPHGG
jgi:beta-aspartyl-peptidase (threonine type)